MALVVCWVLGIPMVLGWIHRGAAFSTAAAGTAAGQVGIAARVTRNPSWALSGHNNGDGGGGEVATALFGTRRLFVGAAATGALALDVAFLACANRDDQAIRERKERLFEALVGSSSILEVGIGGQPLTGAISTNFAFYPPGSRVTGLDPSLLVPDHQQQQHQEQQQQQQQQQSTSIEGRPTQQTMLPLAGVLTSTQTNTRPSELLKAAEAQAGEKGLLFTGVGGVLEALPFPDASFDAVVCTLTLCTVQDQDKALSEVARVLRSGGKFVFMEHIAAAPPREEEPRGEGSSSDAPGEGRSTSWWQQRFGLYSQQQLLEPLQETLAGGCHLTRRTDKAIIDRCKEEGPSPRLFSRLQTLEYFSVGSRWPASRQISGVAIK